MSATSPLLLLFVLIVCLIATAHGQSFTIAGQSSATLPAGTDFATSSYGDPWDYNQRTDFNFMFSEGWQPNQPTVANGILTATSRVDGAYLTPQWEGVSTSLNLDGRVGLAHQIDSSFYNRISFRMRRSISTCAQLHVWHMHSLTPGQGACASVGNQCGFDGNSKRFINLTPAADTQDWTVYKMDLDTVQNVNGNWGSSTVLGLRLHPGAGLPAGTTIEIDWLRLTRRDERTVTFAWAGMGGDVSLTVSDGINNLEIYPDDGSQAKTFGDNSNFKFDYGFLPAGTWTVTARGSSASRQVALVVRPQPVITVTRPAPEGGSSDFAQEAIGDPWDMKNPQDLSRNGGGFWAAQNPQFGADGLHVTYKAPAAPTAVFMDDGGVAGTSIDSQKYRHLTFTIEYDATAKQQHWHNPNPGGSPMEWSQGVARVLYRTRGTDAWSSMEDIVVVDGGAYTYHYDLGDATDHNPQSPTAAVEEGPIWTASAIGAFAIRLGEPCIDAPCAAPPSYRLADVQLRNDEKASSSGKFTVRWNAENVQADHKINIYAEARANTYNNPNFAGRISIASGLPASAGSHEWDVTAVPGGRYFVHVEVVDASGTLLSRALSVTPVYLSGRYNAVGNSQPLAFYPLASLLRLVDTRDTTPATDAKYNAQGVIPGGDKRSWVVAGVNFKGVTIPQNAVALTGTVIVTGIKGGAVDFGGYITIFPSDTPVPLVSTMNPTPGLIQGNMFTVTLNGGAISAYCLFPYNLIIDASGYYAPASAGGLFFVPITPFRILDTRTDPAKYNNFGEITADRPLNIKAAGIKYQGVSIPADAKAITGAFTVVPNPDVGMGGYLTVWPGPAAASRPLASVVNWSPKLNAEQSSITKVGDDLTANIFALAPAHVLWDADGYFSPNGNLGYIPLSSPVRFLDTRPEAAYLSGQGAFKPLDERTYKVAGFEYNGLGVPEEAQAIVGTVTVVRTSLGPRVGYATIYPGTVPRPLIAQMQITLQTPALANAVTVGLGTDGTIKIYATTDTDVLVDIVGYYVPVAKAGAKAAVSESTTTTTSTTSHAHSSSVVAAIVIVACVIGVALVVLLAVLFFRSRSQKQNGDYQQANF